MHIMCIYTNILGIILSIVKIYSYDFPLLTGCLGSNHFGFRMACGLFAEETAWAPCSLSMLDLDDSCDSKESYCVRSSNRNMVAFEETTTGHRKSCKFLKFKDRTWHKIC